ncbi:MAG: hypothetical protein EOO70_00625 [Myxococcaceae bacterium]|nr:MAG: hypothetical protein EOO70_00625 [Myxococcaceae bacterium]
MAPPRCRARRLREGVFELCWRQHGGSGLGVTVGDVLDLDTSDRDWILECIREQRAKEAQALERAGKKR